VIKIGGKTHDGRLYRHAGSVRLGTGEIPGISGEAGTGLLGDWLAEVTYGCIGTHGRIRQDVMHVIYVRLGAQNEIQP